MKIELKFGDHVTYMQETDDSKHLNAVVAFLMQQPQGDKAVATVTVANNGHTLPFNLSAVDVEGLVRKVNGIVTKVSRTATATATA